MYLSLIERRLKAANGCLSGNSLQKNPFVLPANTLFFTQSVVALKICFQISLFGQTIHANEPNELGAKIAKIELLVIYEPLPF